MSGNANKDRGSRWEADIVTYLRQHGFPEAVRIRGRGRNDEGDIGGFARWAIEAKDWKTPAFTAWLTQAKAEAVNAGKPFAVVVWKRRRRPAGDAFVITDLSTWVAVESQLRERGAA